MLKNKKLLIGLATLASSSIQANALEQNYASEDRNLTTMATNLESLVIPCIAKVPENCPEDPVYNKAVRPIPGAPSPIGYIETKKALECLQLFEAQVSNYGIIPLPEDKIINAEVCLDLFTAKLLAL